MPRPVKAWDCSFKCWEKVQTVKKRIVEHEAKCLLNPVRRACPTCKHNNEWKVEHKYSIWRCDLDNLVGWRQECVFDCEQWGQK